MSNPFKILGSYLGAIVGGAAFIYLITQLGILKNVSGVGFNSGTFLFFAQTPDLYTWIVTGWTLGWGIQSLINIIARRMK